MRTYVEIMAGAKPGSPFSNGTEGNAWMSGWCDRCVHDDLDRQDSASKIFGCLIVAAALQERTPSEWVEQDPWSLDERYVCVEFRSEDDDGGAPGPRPVPDPPGQETLLPRELCEGTRMLTRPPVEVPV